MNEKDYQRKKNKFLPKIHAWYSLFLSNPFSAVAYCGYQRNDSFELILS